MNSPDFYLLYCMSSLAAWCRHPRVGGVVKQVRQLIVLGQAMDGVGSVRKSLACAGSWVTCDARGRGMDVDAIGVDIVVRMLHTWPGGRLTRPLHPKWRGPCGKKAIVAAGRRDVAL